MQKLRTAPAASVTRITRLKQRVSGRHGLRVASPIVDISILWEPVLELPMRFNRLIIFRSDFYHAVTELFGTTVDDGRLVQLFHFEAKPD